MIPNDRSVFRAGVSLNIHSFIQNSLFKYTVSEPREETI